MGGPEALEYILSRLPADIPPMVIVQHMPQGFTQAFARRLEARCRFRVVEARDGDALEMGRALLAPGNRHLVVRQVTTGLRAFLEDAPPEAFHRPSVNVLFRSVATAVRANAVGVILTGMGDDGAAGLRAMRDAGARTLAQDEASSVVFGMPRVAASMGAVQQLVPLALMPSEIMKACERQVRTERGRESAS
jgi:two-component system chemotaxis response regulator CheB